MNRCLMNSGRGRHKIAAEDADVLSVSILDGRSLKLKFLYKNHFIVPATINRKEIPEKRLSF
jgi:hypothetical protein